MNLLSPGVVVLQMLDALLLFLASIALILSVSIARKWDPDATTPQQYRLEKRSYLVATVVAYIFYLKLLLFLYFIHTLDDLAALLPGAMCAAGVTDATPYGTPLFVVKILDLYLFGLWLVLHRIDTKRVDRPYTRTKFRLYLLLFPFLVLETILQFLHFGAIDPHRIVSCCGTLFSAPKTPLIGLFTTLPAPAVAGLFYLLYAAILLAWLRRSPTATAISNLLFIPVAVLSLITLFSTYIYQMPHHHCPFCLLQADYGYVGYLLYTALFGGTFFGLAAWVAEKCGDGRVRRWMVWSVALDTLYVAVVSFHPIAYYLENGVWL